MNDTVRPVFHGFEQIPLREYAERAYLDYSMYVVLDRALPFLGDGLKPVQRRIIYRDERARPRRRRQAEEIRAHRRRRDRQVPSARRLACYEALVLMAQPFSYRYPLIEGQGNFGSQRRSRSRSRRCATPNPS